MAETVISDFQAGHSWVKYGAPGTVSDDASIYKFGTQSLKLVTDGAAGECKIRWTGISPAIDMTGKFFLLWVRIDGIDNLNRLWLYAYSTAWTAGYCWKPSDAPSHWLDSGGGTHGSDGTWIPITLSFGKPVVAGSPNRAAITNFQLYAQDKNGTPVTIHWGGLHSITEEGPGRLTFTFDDCWESIYSQGYAYLSTKGFPAVLYLAHEELGNAGRMTQANIDAMYAGNWDIAGHYGTELDVVPDLDAALDDIQAYHANHGYARGILDFSFPGGVWNEGTIMPAVKARFRTARTIIPYSETIPVADNYRLRVLEVADTTAPATIAAAVTGAINNKEWLILVFHKIVAVPSATIEYSIANFQAVVDDIQAQGIPVKTLHDILYTGAPVGGASPGLLNAGLI